MKLADKPAYPVWGGAVNEGLTLREHYAGLAMQGILAGDTEGSFAPKDIAKGAVLYADALINELESDGEQR